MIGVKNAPLFQFSVRMTYKWDKCKMKIQNKYSVLFYSIVCVCWSGIAFTFTFCFIGATFCCWVPFYLHAASFLVGVCSHDLEIYVFWLQVRKPGAPVHICWMQDCISVCLATTASKHVQTLSIFSKIHRQHLQRGGQRLNHHLEITILYPCKRNSAPYHLHIKHIKDLIMPIWACWYFQLVSSMHLSTHSVGQISPKYIK